MVNTESFYRGRIGETILSNKNTPFSLKVSVLPIENSGYITISPDTEKEEIFFYNGKTGNAGEAGTITVVGRGYNKNNSTALVGNQKEHPVNDIFKGALNHIIINDKSSKSEDNTFTGNNTFNGNVFLGKGFRVPEFANATARDIAIPTPSDGMICYLQDVEDYYSYKNGIWVKGLGGSGGSVTWYQDSTADGSITGTIDGVNTTFTLSNTPAQPQAVILTYNGQMLDYGDDYTIVGKNITMILVPVSGRLAAYYPDTPVGTGSADTRVTSNADAKNGELYRSTDDSNSLYYKDNLGNFKFFESTITGEIKIWTTGIAPSKWLICDGSAVSRTTYATLFGVIGTSYGAGDGSTTFNIPNLKGKVVVGFNSAETEFDTLGETGGAKTHTLTVDEIPAHTHKVPVYNNTNNTTTGGRPTAYGYDNNISGNPATSSTGGGQAHNNLQPYVVLQYIIRT